MFVKKTDAKCLQRSTGHRRSFFPLVLTEGVGVSHSGQPAGQDAVLAPLTTYDIE